MYKCMKIIVLCLALSSADALKLPDYVHRCSVKDPEFDACVLKSAKETVPHMIDGLKQYHIPVLDPLYVTEVRTVDGDLDMGAQNVTAEGIRNIIIKSVRFDLKKKEITVETVVPEAHFTGNYEVKGKLMSLPIVGKGPLDAKFYDLYVKYVTNYELKKLDDGEVHLMPYNYTGEFEPRRVTAKLGNLFNGNKVLGDNMNTFINENWREVLKVVGKPTYDALGLIIHTMITEASKTVPYKNVFLDVE
uniref:Ssp1 protein n=1 Tax=Reticulitermes aculabialis TaxID=141915 RepID=A0A8K1VRU8_9NEOP|nr:ssp1 protein [Reticulitermes aculabialis]